ncbi:MAG: hypothetical protein Kow0099_36820 [Candidatus Abyssubacteria bacterium]
MLVVDNGDVNAGYGRQSELKYETAMKAMAEMGYSAVNVGEQDLLLGVDYLKYVSDFTGIRLISANLVDDEGQPVFEQFVLERLNAEDTSFTAAVIGIISAEFKETVEDVNPWLRVDDYEPTLERLMDELRSQADVLVVLAHMSDQEARALAASFPQIDLIVVSHSGDDPFPFPESEGEVPLAYAGTKGMHVGVIDLAVKESPARMESYVVRALDQGLADSQRMTVILDDYQKMLKIENLLESYPRRDYGEAEFVGDKGCQRCHSFSTWRFRGSKHAHAFDPIAEKGRHYDPECVRCHTVGFGYKSGFITVEATPDLQHVGCENCHGAGSRHIEQPMDLEYGEVKQETCKSCHDPENSPKFKYDDYITQIKHNSFFLCSAKICHWLD